MKKLNIKQVVTLTVVMTSLTGIFALTQASQVEPGSNQDPVVTLSYVEKRVQDVLTIMDTKISALGSQTTPVVTAPSSTPVSETPTSAVFETVFVEKGQFVYFGASTEVILRSGEGTVIASVNGGVSDLTDGRDIENKSTVSANHHLLVPRDDGRGFALHSDAWILIKGKYTVIK